jgi:hypothetical protein
VVRDHQDSTPIYCRQSGTKAVADGLNIKIMATKHRACGYLKEEPVKSKLRGSLGHRRIKGFWPRLFGRMSREVKKVFGAPCPENTPQGFCS